MARQKNKRWHALLISPRPAGSVTSNDAVFPFPLLGLTQIAATFPPQYSVEIRDERVSPVRGSEHADIVFITTLTTTALRAYGLADLFRQRGIPVVVGGVHATVLPDEASQHATAVVIGEAEGIMEKLLADFEQGSLLPRYRCENLVDLNVAPLPARQLLGWKHRIFLSALQTSRGCPHTCSFCSVPHIAGHTVRLKSLATIEQEVQALSRFRSRKLFVVDDNFTMNRGRALAIMDIFRHYGFKWMGFSTLALSEDEEFLQALRLSGCMSLFIGFESLHGQAQAAKNRSYETPAAIRAAVDRIHSFAIGIQGSFIFGFDEDTADVFQETVAFIQSAGIELPTISLLTPFPGTQLFDSLDREGRIISYNWPLYDMSHVVFQPRNMTPDALQQGYAWALKYLASPTSILKRLRHCAGSKAYFFTANFSLRNGQTRLAHSLWNRAAQSCLQERAV